MDNFKITNIVSASSNRIWYCIIVSEIHTMRYDIDIFIDYRESQKFFLFSNHNLPITELLTIESTNRL